MPACKLAWAAASARRTRCSGSLVRTTERCRNAAAAARPPRACARPAELLERRGNRLVGSRCGGGQMPRATVGVDAGVGRLCQGQMDLPALLSGRRSVDRRAHQRMTEGHALSEREQPVRLRASAAAEPRSRVARPRASSSSGSPTGSAAATSSRRRASSESASTRRTKLSSIRPASALRAPTRPKPPASCLAVKPRGSSSNASGFPRVSAMIRSRIRSSNLKRTAELEQRAGVAVVHDRAPPSRSRC